MRKLFNRIKDTLVQGVVISAAAISGIVSGAAVRRAVANRSGEGYVDTAVKILIAVVIGALVLAALFALFGDVVMPAVTQRVRDMFNYNG